METLRNFGVILNFAESTITIDHHEVLMRPLGAFSSIVTHIHVPKRGNYNTHQVTSFPGAPPHPVTVTEATDRTMGILDASYEQVQLDCRSPRRTRKINLPTNKKGYDNSETVVEKLLARRIQIYPEYLCLGIILKVILNNFQNYVLVI